MTLDFVWIVDRFFIQDVLSNGDSSLDLTDCIINIKKLKLNICHYFFLEFRIGLMSTDHVGSLFQVSYSFDFA